MLTTSNSFTLCILIFLSVLLIILLNYVLNRKKKKQLDKVFVIAFGLLLFWMLCSILQIFCVEMFNANPIYFDYFTFISVCFLPVVFLFMALIFARTKITFKKSYYLLFIIPVLTLILVWTNDFHHLVYKQYSTNFSDNIFGSYFYIHYFYTYLLYAISLFILIKYSIKNSGFFSKQAVLILIGSAVPAIINVLAAFSIIPTSVYITPITFALSIICFTFAAFRFDLLKTTPIALQRIVDRISDSYVVLNEDYQVSDFNETFINTFNIKNPSSLRGNGIEELFKEHHLDFGQFKGHIEKTKDNDKTESFELYIKRIKKYFNIEITSIIVNAQFLGTLILFKDITQHEQDMQTIKSNQDMLMERERLASLGQLIGGIAHNLKTPIMSISGAAEGLNDLIKEYDSSIDDPEVNSNDHHEIAKDMSTWVQKIKEYTEYMSDIITTVKGQAVTLAADYEVEFTIEELINRVDILMKHELKNALVYLNIAMHTDEKTTIHGDVNSLVQVINNMISNSIQAYNGKPEQNIDMSFYMQDNNLVISIKDYAGGLPKKVKDKLFKEMITTKGKNGTGLGLYMSYSNIKARFNGDITFESNSEGTTFNIILPV